MSAARRLILIGRYASRTPGVEQRRRQMVQI
jgi:hypothetical protein